MMAESWQPTACLRVIRQRAELLYRVREFFRERDLLEVETPLLSASTITDPHIEVFSLHSDDRLRYLQTSPEYAMKRLLANNSGPIYQICKAFRCEEQGSKHHREFTILEWYRPGFDHHQLMVEVGDLVIAILGELPIRKYSYAALFEQHLHINPHTADLEQLSSLAHSLLDVDFTQADRGLWLDLLFSSQIEPYLQGLNFVYDYPTCQAALARIETEQDLLVARRFEVYVDGMELANGYLELCDAHEQEERFEQENQQREGLGKVTRPVDWQMLAALKSGLPACAGVALGLDRLLMLKTGMENIAEVISFAND